MQKGAFLLVAIAALLTVAGCPAAQKKTAEVDQPAPIVGDGAISGTPVAADASAAAGDTDIDVDVEVDTTEEKSASAEQPKLDPVPEGSPFDRRNGVVVFVVLLVAAIAIDVVMSSRFEAEDVQEAQDTRQPPRSAQSER